MWNVMFKINRVMMLMSMGNRLASWATRGKQHFAQKTQMATPVEPAREARMLAELCSQLDKDRETFKPDTALSRIASPEIQQWYRTVAADHKRRAEAMNKLTPEDRKVLGL